MGLDLTVWSGLVPALFSTSLGLDMKEIELIIGRNLKPEIRNLKPEIRNKVWRNVGRAVYGNVLDNVSVNVDRNVDRNVSDNVSDNVYRNVYGNVRRVQS